jgi:hypothetical protein
MITLRTFLYVSSAIGIMAGCSKPDVDDNGLADTDLNAEFTMTPVAGSAYRFVVAANDSSYIMSKWDLDNGAGAVAGRHSQQIFLPDAGSYNIKHFAVGKGGAIFTASKTVNIAVSDPAAGNLLQGSKFETAEDEAKWTKFTIGGTSVSWSRAGGKMTVTGGNWGHAGIYQAVQVQANKDYRFDMIVSGSGATETWFEVYFGKAAPVAGSDYTEGGRRIGLSTWDGCGGATFSGKITEVGCVGDLIDSEGKVRFAQSGTIYLVIKSGGANLGTSGISIDNVELRGIQ